MLKLSSVIVLMVSIFIRISDCESREVKTTECLVSRSVIILFRCWWWPGPFCEVEGSAFISQ